MSNVLAFKLSDNISELSNGSIKCLNVPINRVGVQEYLESDVIKTGDPNKLIKVHRPASEVFAPTTMASFENMTVTNEHPHIEVDIDNYHHYAKGFVTNDEFEEYRS